MTEIVVTGSRSLVLRPVRSIASEDLGAYGAGTVSELLEEVTRENGDGGAPITILVDGKRVTGLGDIDSYPAEALARVDILPRESGGAVGAPAGSRVYNIVLKPRTRLGVARGRARAATSGGTAGATVDLSATQIRRPQRLNLALQLRRDGALLDSERGIVQSTGSPAQLGRFRTLRPGTNGAELTFSVADRVAGWLSGLATVKLGEDRGRSRLGLTESEMDVTRHSRRRLADLSAQLMAETGDWQAVLDAGHRRDRRAILTLKGNDREPSSILSSSTSIDLLAFGPLVRFGTGPVTLSLGASYRRDQSGGLGSDGTESRFVRNSRELRSGIDIPLLNRSGPLGGLGTMNVRAELRRGRADGATISGRSLSLRWAPAGWLDLTASENRSRMPASAELVGAPLLETEGVRYFDPLRSETVDIVTVTGGLPDLPGTSSRMRRLAADLRPLPERDLLLTAEYGSMRTRNVLAGLPPATAEVIRLFPDRFRSDSTGRLTLVDLRPVVFRAMGEDQLRFGANLTLPLRPGTGAPRLQLAGSYRLLLRSRLEPGPAAGPVDLLSRSSIGVGGMRPRHQFDLSLGYSERGLGLRLSGERRSRSFLASSGETGILVFQPLTTFSLRAFAEGSRLAPGSPLLRGSRLGLSVNNVGNRRERVRDEEGSTPLAFQPALRDPVGRTIEIEFRKTF